MPVGSNAQQRGDFLSVRKGKLEHKPDKNEAARLYDYVEGNFIGLSIIWDEGKEEAQVKAHWVLEIMLQDEERVWKVQGSHGTTFSRCIAKYLPDMQPNQPVRLKVWPGEQNSKVTVAMVCHIGDASGAAPKPLKATPYPKDMSQEEKNKIADQIIRSHPCFLESEAADNPSSVGFFGFPVGTLAVPGEMDMPVAASGKVLDAISGQLAGLFEKYDKDKHKDMASLLLTLWAKACGKERVVKNASDLSLGEAKLLGRFLHDHPEAGAKAASEAAATVTYDPFADD